MPVRTVKLKLVLGSSSATQPVREAIWTTHEVVNQAVAAIIETLLLCRGEEYWTRDSSDQDRKIPRSEVRAKALAMARSVQQRNACPESSALSDDVVLSLLRQLYEQLIPSCLLDKNGKPQEGNAQAVGGWVRPMVDPTSDGNLAIFAKVLDPPPAWFAAKERGDSDWLRQSEEWLATDEAKRLLNATGSPAGWIRQLRRNEPWQESLINDQQKKRKEITSETGAGPLTRRLKQAGLLPLFLSTSQRDLAPAPKDLRIYDALAMRLAAAHLLSWESWNHRTRRAHQFLIDRHTRITSENQPFQPMFQHLRAYESARHQRLKEVALADDSRPFRISTRTIRAWDTIRERWWQDGGSVEKRKQILANLQTSLRGRFGDPDLFLWLAQDSQVHLWRQRDTLTPLARQNMSQRELDRRKPFAIMTLPDSRLHPRWLMYEAPNGSNLKNYNLLSEAGQLTLVLPLLRRQKNGALVEEKFQVPLAASTQFAHPSISENSDASKGKTQVCFSSASQNFTASLGGADLLLHRRHLASAERSIQSVANGSIGAVWLKLSLDVDSQAPASWCNADGKLLTPPEIHHFKTALSNKSKHADKLAPGLRVLSVDLGLRTFASCSVFELKQGKPTGGLFFPAEDDREEHDPQKLWAVHERSFQLKLPGEAPSPREVCAREEATRVLRALRKDIRRLREILRLSTETNELARKEKLNLFLEALAADARESCLNADHFSVLHLPESNSTLEAWQRACSTAFQSAEAKVSEAFSHWRKQTRPRPDSWIDWRSRRSYAAGKSIWAIEYLDAVRKLIISWNLRGRVQGQINRLDRAARGTVASALLTHINNLKSDRTKTGADLIIQAARGMVPSPSGAGWVSRYEPCRLILFEDLARYRFRVDRPRRENSQLMRWNHREVAREVQMQAEVYGIAFETTAAGFSSRYLAADGRPGLRCRTLTARDFDGDVPKPYVVNELQLSGSNSLRPGILVPWLGGELFATLSPSGAAHILNADLNAAHNLQRRFWMRCGDAYRISVQPVQLGDDQYYEVISQDSSDPDKIGARLLGALQNSGWNAKLALTECPEREHYRWVQPAGLRRRKVSKADDKLSAEEEDLLLALDDESLEHTDANGKRLTLFRDPSGAFFSRSLWLQPNVYWGSVKQRVSKALSNLAPRHSSQVDEDEPF